MPQWNPRDGICSGCGTKFRRSGAFDQHMSGCPRNLLALGIPQWNPRDGVCSGCGTKFRRSGAFDGHVSTCPRNLLSHPELPQWNPRDGLCNGCGAKFRRSGAFDQHMSECPRNLLSHGIHGEEHHQQEDEIKCPICQAVMWSYDELERHRNENHNLDCRNESQAAYGTPAATSNLNKDRMCRRCYRQFISRNALFNHLYETEHYD